MPSAMTNNKKKVESTPAVARPWQPPAELQRYIPRQVELTAGGKAVVSIAVLLLAGAAALGIGFYLANERQERETEAFRREGVTVEAQVVSSGRMRDDNRTPFVVYRYEAAGRQYRRRATLYPHSRQPMPAGSSIAIRYLPGQPGRSRMVGRDPEPIPLPVVALVPSFLTLMAGLVWRQIRVQSRLLSEGRPAEAKVLVSKKFATKARKYQGVYEFRVLSGASRTIRIRSDKQPPAAGTIVTLLYDPDNDRRAVVYPLPLVRVAKGT